jgi:hypothetical protein
LALYPICGYVCLRWYHLHISPPVLSPYITHISPMVM